MSQESAIDFQFIQIPLWMFDEKWQFLSLEACVLYALLRDRVSLSVKNKLFDENGTYVFFELGNIEKALRCSRHTAVKAKKELAEVGLITEKRQGLGLANKIYVASLKEVQNYTPEVQNYTPEVQNQHGNHTKINHTKINHTKINQLTSSSGGGNSYIDIEPEGQKLPQPQQKYPKWKFVDHYQNVMPGILTLNGEQFNKLQEYILVDGFEEELVMYAISESADNHNPSFRLVDFILNECRKKGIKTVAQKKASRQKTEDKKKVRFGPMGSKY